ncbi:MAG: YihY/virulence factor BrkB family protein [Anaerolineae bacterium]
MPFPDQRFLDQLQQLGKDLYDRVNRSTGGAPTIVTRAAKHYGETGGSQAAASLAYYIFFSLFPLLLVLVAAVSHIWDLESEQAFREAVEFISQAIPISQDLIADNLQAVLQQRGTVTLIGLVGTLWSASGAFTTLTKSINAAWEGTQSRGFVKQRLVAIGMVLAVVALLLLSLASTTFLTIVPEIAVPDAQFPFLRAVVGTFLSWGPPLILNILMFIALYHWIPTKTVRWRAVLLGAGIAAIAWEVAKVLITEYLSSSLVNYELVYGSLGSVVALLFWIYISSTITLFSAHLTAEIDQYEEEP